MQGYGMLIFLLTSLLVVQATDANQCLQMLPEVNPKRFVQIDGQSLMIPLELTHRTTQRLVTRIMRIFLTEVLGYRGVGLIELDDEFDAEAVFIRMSDIIAKRNSRSVPETMVNMEVWISPQNDTSSLFGKFGVQELGSITTPGRLGWFVPEKLSEPDDSWRTFSDQRTAARFDVDRQTLDRIRALTLNPQTGRYYCQEEFCQDGMYIPPQCESLPHKNQPCALLLTSQTNVTQFVRDHIDQLKLYVKVAWVGPNLQDLIASLQKEYIELNSENGGVNKKSLVALYWTPSEIIPNEREFIAIDFPRCGSRALRVGCTYETHRLVKVAWSKLELLAKVAWEAINRVKLTGEMYEDLINRYNKLSKNQSEDEIACGWLIDNLNYALSEWTPKEEDKNTLYIGGIFPMSGTEYTARSLVVAARMAKEAINANNTLLRDYNLILVASDGQCKSDRVMKAFIDYILHNLLEKLVGVLGPACSETVEPLVGVSKHYKTVVISYAAEGSSFNDRTRYPYFFRTIGENKQYRHVYAQLFKSFGWKRVAALTEDGQKYTEYISYMQNTLRENGIKFIANIKFPRERGEDKMTQYLEDLKQKRARIVIADVNNKVAREVMCQAYKLQMTPLQGYVWFLPLWLQSNWYDTDYHNGNGTENIPCTTAQMSTAINGHLSISHAYFAPDDELMQEGKTVARWRQTYAEKCRRINETPSIYAGYVYDAMWTYAYAMDRLVNENQSYVFDLHANQTVNRLTEIIAETNFQGVSGGIKFLGGSSRFSVVDIFQRIDNELRMVGNFYPNISESKRDVVGGRLQLNKSALVWLSNKIPDDGSEPPARCVLGGLAEFLNVTCEVAIVIANVIGLILLAASLITGFIIVKRKYDEKVLQHQKVMESFGLDARHTTSGLDKWEIPRDRVVINRKLGEGAFGTVYGGEAFFPEKGWLAVAVKTLKEGSNTEEKLDFLSEVEVMKRFEHKNIIKLLGVCIKSPPVLTVMEFMLYGDLKTYLLARRHLVNDQSYEDSDEISNKRLTAMAIDVAKALSYLAQLKYIHRDVASRNCLVNAQRVVKLADFGMTRPMYESDYYKFIRKGMLPVRWMAPESLALGIFSPATDVWSYGVLLFEIITFGSFPFQGMNNNEVLAHVKSGNSLQVPKGVKPSLEALVNSCWAVDPKKRPTAPEIVDFLAQNPRILSPCLDVPLASVQLENPDPFDLPLQDSIRKFSMQLSWPIARRPTTTSDTSAYVTTDNTNAPLLNLSQDDNRVSASCDDSDGSKPLLGEQPFQASNVKPNDIPRYVNLQPTPLRLGLNSDMHLHDMNKNTELDKNGVLRPSQNDSIL